MDVIAPGVDVAGPWFTADGATATASGTSMASPHVAGAAATVLSVTSAASPDRVAAALRQSARPDTVTGTEPYCYVVVLCTTATPNLLLRTDS